MKRSAWFMGVAALACFSAADAQDRYDAMGFYFGNPVPSSMPAYDAFVSRVNQIPTSTTMFVDYRYPIWAADPAAAQWGTSARWAAKSLASMTAPEYLDLRDAQGRPAIVPIVSIGLTDEPTAFQHGLPEGHAQRGKYSEAAAVAMMKSIAAGKYDAGTYRVWPAILDAYRDNGFGRIYLRIGWEQNGDWYGWRTRTTATRDAYIAAWRHVANLAHTYAAANAMTIETVWSPSASFANYGLAEESSYPGDAYVDIIAPTAYSSIWNATRNADRTAWYDWSTKQSVTLEQWYANAVNRKHSWDHPASDYWNPTRGWGMAAAIDFAMAHDKRFGLSETGTGAAGMVTQGGGPPDDGDYPLYLAERLTPAMSRGLEVEFIDIWAVATGSDGKTFLSGARPKEAQAWKEFGVVMAAAKAKRNVARARAVTASSTYNTVLAAKNVTDGKSTTRWAAKDGGLNQWVRVDLGQRFTISRVKLQWDAGYASSYKVQVSPDALAWTDIYTTTAGNGGTDDLVGLTGLGRYVRVLCSARKGNWTYSLREMDIYP